MCGQGFEILIASNHLENLFDGDFAEGDKRGRSHQSALFVFDRSDRSRAERDVQAKFLLRNGADEVVYPEKQVANWASIRYTADHIRDYIEVDDSHAIFEVEVPEGWIGKTVGELDIRRKYSINIMATKENGKINMAVSPETVLTDKITLLVLGAYKELQRCFRI